MKPGHWLTLGSAIAGCTAALGIYLATQDPPPGGSAPRTNNDRWQPAAATKRQVFTAVSPRPARAAQKTAERPGHNTDTTSPTFRIHGKPPADRVADESAWFASAERVEHQANRELESLRETLDLNPHQQQQIFDILARNSPSWMPGMLTGGSNGVGVVSDGAILAGHTGNTSNHAEATPAVSLADEVLNVLDYDQQQALVEEELNRRAWWEEILPQLLPPEFPTAAAAENPAASLPVEGDTKAYQGPTEMLEE